MDQHTILYEVIICIFCYLLSGSLCPWGVGSERMRLSLSYTHGLCSTLTFIGFTCVISIISTCVLNNLHIDTVGYLLWGLPPPSGCHSCVGFFVCVFPLPHSSAKSWFSSHLSSIALLPSVPSRYTWRTWLGLVGCCRHHPFRSSRFSKPGLT